MTDQTNWKGGYGTPPHAHRFKKGQSGNPAGRKAAPQPVRALGDRALEHLRREVQVKTASGRSEKIPVLDAVLLRGQMLAMKTDNLPQLNRYLANLVALGFDYNFEASSARIEERNRHAEELAKGERRLAICHESLRHSGREIEALKQELARLKGAAPDKGTPLD